MITLTLLSHAVTPTFETLSLNPYNHPKLINSDWSSKLNKLIILSVDAPLRSNFLLKKVVLELQSGNYKHDYAMLELDEAAVNVLILVVAGD